MLTEIMLVLLVDGARRPSDGDRGRRVRTSVLQGPSEPAHFTIWWYRRCRWQTALNPIPCWTPTAFTTDNRKQLFEFVKPISNGIICIFTLKLASDPFRRWRNSMAGLPGLVSEVSMHSLGLHSLVETNFIRSSSELLPGRAVKKIRRPNPSGLRFTRTIWWMDRLTRFSQHFNLIFTPDDYLQIPKSLMCT
jgi:hypothetical protein